jgi:type I restriction enzyme S subunit
VSKNGSDSLPAGWAWKQLGECAHLINGRAYSQHELLDTGTPVLRIQNLNGSERWYYSNLNLPEEKYCRAGDLLFAWSASFGPYRFAGPKSIFHYHIWRVVPKSILDRAFAYYLLDWITEKVKAAAHGLAMLHMTKAGMEAWTVPLPPLSEQRRIAEMLDRAEALRAKRRAALAQLDTLTESIFLDMFGQPATNLKNWPTRTLGEVSRSKPNNGLFRKNHEYVQAGFDGLPVVWVEELFREGSIDTTASRRVVPASTEVAKYGLTYGDVLFCRSSLKLDGIAFNNVYLGSDGEALFECHLIRVQPNMSIISPIYLNYLLRLPQMRAVAKSKSKTATMTTIDQDSLCSIPVVLPPLARQQDFVDQVCGVERVKENTRSSLRALDALCACLQHHAFRGEL